MVSVIIPHTSTNIYRKRNLQFICEHYLSLLPEIEILVIEQDLKSKIQNEISKNVKHIFLKNNFVYNKSWAINIGVKLAKYENLVIADDDILIQRNTFIKSIYLLNLFESVNPFGKLFDLSIKTSNLLIENKEVDLSKCDNYRRNINYASALFLIRKKAFNYIGGCEEEFEGWGGEDDVLSLKIETLLFHTTLNKSNGYHLFHDRASEYEEPFHPKYIKNIEHINSIYKLSMNKNNLIEHCRKNIITNGKIDKYT